MIFATVGTHHDGFPRMLTALESLRLDGEELVVQHGHGPAPTNATEAKPFYTFGEMAVRFERARVVVTHAGVGSILVATRAGHRPIVFPRRAQHGEHVDDHQVELARALQQDDRVLVCWEADQLAGLVDGAHPRRALHARDERPLARAVGRALRDSGAPATQELRGLRLLVARLRHDVIGAYFGVGTAFKPQPPGPHARRDALAGYWCDFTHKVAAAEIGPGTRLAHALAGEPHAESPMVVAQAALGFWDRLLSGETDAEAGFHALADWLARDAEHTPAGAVWRHRFAVPKYGLDPGWVSGMTQSQAISVLLRSHAATGDETHLQLAVDALGPFTAPVDRGGVVCEIDGALVIEEYPTATPSAVLNGWIFGLIGLHELSLTTGGGDAGRLFARSREGLLGLLGRYDVGWWSCYSLGPYARPDLAKPFYQRLHPVLLDALDCIAPDPALRHTAQRWRDQITALAMARLAADKAAFRAYRALRPTTR